VTWRWNPIRRSLVIREQVGSPAPNMAAAVAQSVGVGAHQGEVRRSCSSVSEIRKPTDHTIEGSPTQPDPVAAGMGGSMTCPQCGYCSPADHGAAALLGKNPKPATVISTGYDQYLPLPALISASAAAMHMAAGGAGSGRFLSRTSPLPLVAIHWRLVLDLG